LRRLRPVTARGVVVIQEIFGVNDVVRKICDGHAAKGDLRSRPISSGGSSRRAAHRQEPGALEPRLRTDAEIDHDKGMADIQASISYLRKVPAAPERSVRSVTVSGGRLAISLRRAPIPMLPSGIMASISRPP